MSFGEPEKPENCPDLKAEERKLSMKQSDDDALALLGALSAGLREEERVSLCGFAGDPDAAEKTAWRPRPWRPGREIPFGPGDNAYATVAAFGKAPDGSYRRRVDTFRAGLALMVDDVGTKVPRETVAAVEPTAIVETSPGNEQWWYVLAAPQRDVSRFDALIRAFIASRLLGADPGMSGVNRVGRLPGFTNGKRKHSGFRTRLLRAQFARRVTEEELIGGFGLELRGQRFVERAPRGSEELVERVRSFETFAAQMRAAGMLKGEEFDPSGWIEVQCPWIAAHTNTADSGAAIRRPGDENGWYGAFRCHHGHCADRGWGDLTDWLDEQNADAFAAAQEHHT